MLKTDILVPPNLQKWIDKAISVNSNVKDYVRAVVFESAENIVVAAKDKVPFSTGALSGSIEATYLESGMTAVIGSYLPYAAKWEYSTVDHPVRPAEYFKRGAKKGLLKYSGQKNPNAQWGYLRKSLFDEQVAFFKKLLEIVKRFQ